MTSVPGEPSAGPPLTPPAPPAATAVFAGRIGLARSFAALLAGPGIDRGLIGPREGPRLWDRHILNCAVLGEVVPVGVRVVDVGSGAGLPGLPLAIARPDLQVDLVEPLERRAVFLRECIDELGLTEVRVIRGRADEVVDQVGGADVVTARAVAPLARLSGWCAPLLRSDGAFLVVKGDSAAAELERDRVEMAGHGLVDGDVVHVGAGVVDPLTTVVRARRVDLGSPDRRRRAGGRRGSR